MLKPNVIIEKALIRAFPAQSEAAKTVYRYELASWFREAEIQVAQQVLAKHLLDARDVSFRAFQRTYAASLGRRDALLSWALDQSWSAARGWNWSGDGNNAPAITVRPSPTGTTVAGVLNSFIAANESLLAPVVNDVAQPIANNYLEFIWDSSQPIALAFFPTGVTPTSRYDDAQALLTVLIEGPGQLSAFAESVGVLNPDLTIQMLKGYRVRIVFGSDGAITLKVIGEGETELGGYPLLVWPDGAPPEGVPLTITADVVPVLQFGADGAQVKNVRVGLMDTRAAWLPRDYPLIIESLLKVGNVRFENGKSLAWAGDTPTAFLPRIAGLWYYRLVNNTIRIDPALPSATALPPAARLLITGCVALKCEELPMEYELALIENLVNIARERAGTKKMPK